MSRLIFKHAIYFLCSVKRIGENHGKSGHQVVLRWAHQNKISIVPRSSDPLHMRENADIFDFHLTASELAVLDSLRYMIASPLFLSPMEKSDNIFDVEYRPLPNFHRHECLDAQARVVTFHDECRDGTVSTVFWIDHNGGKIDAGTLETEIEMNSFINHVFECRNQRFVVTSERGQVFAVNCA
jgi:hypothetical protein